MTKLRILISRAATLAGARGAFAEQATDALVEIFDKELRDPKSVHRQREGQSVEDRIFLFRAILRGTPGVDQAKAEYIVNVVTLYAYSCAVASGRKDLELQRNALAGKLDAEESENIDVAAVMTVADAATALRWG